MVAIVRPNKGKALEKIVKLIKTSMSRMNVDYMYLRKLYFSALTFVCSLFIIISSLIIGWFYTWNNIDSAGLIGGTELSKEEKAILTAMDNKYFSMPPLDDEKLAEFIKENYPNIKSSRIQKQADRIREKEEALSEIYFKWWYLGVSMLLAYFAWRIPELMLKFRTMLIKAESEEDCLQLQTVIAIMMNTSIDTLDLLDWLGKHSRVFKPILIDAYHAYPADAYRALRELKYKAGLADFKRLVDKLMLTVSQISIAEAFSDLIIEREHLLRMRELSQEESILKKRQIMSIVATLPMGATIALYFVAPIALIGIKELGGLLGGSGLI